MCTVTYIPLGKGFILSSSRDETIFRPTLKPVEYNIGRTKVIFPKDTKAGGSWIAMSPNRVACLLNGAFSRYKKQGNSNISRGLILLDSFLQSMDNFIHKSEFQNVEPFTLLLLETCRKFRIVELRWDGVHKHIKHISSIKPHIWLSATLYPPAIQKKRIQIFNEWLKYSSLETADIAEFHMMLKQHNEKHLQTLKKKFGLQTLSISQVRIEKNNSFFSYYDFTDNKVSQVKFHR